MLEGLLGAFIDKEQVTKDYITDALELVANEYGLTHKQVAVMIQPKDEEFNFKMYVIQTENGTPKKVLRELTVKELVAAYNDRKEDKSSGE